MELNHRPADGPEREREYPKGRFFLFLALLVLILAFISAAQRLDVRAVEGPAISEIALQASIAAKAAYAYRHAELLGPAREVQARQFEDLALLQYKRAVKEAANANDRRRLIILQYEAGRPDLRQNISALEKGGRRGAERVRLAREAAMWRHIYLGEKLTRDDVDVYEQRIRKSDLGWYEHLALNHLYGRAGLRHQAREQQRLATRAATANVLSLAGVIIAIIVLGMFGLGLLARYAGRKRRRGSEVYLEPEVEPAARERIAGYLLETFVVYLGIAIGVQLLGPVVVHPGVAGTGKLSSTPQVLVTAGVYITGGLLALAYLAARLKSAGWSWHLVGLRSRQPWTDIAWGIGGYAAAVPLILTAAVLSKLLSQYVRTPENPVIPLFVESETLFERLVLLALAVVIAPFFEELFFRGVLYTSFRAKWGIAAGVVGSALAFAGVHPLPLGLLPIFVLGAVFAVLLRERSSLLPGMIAHSMNNAVAFALLFVLAG